MYYHVTLWKNIKDNDESKADTQTIMGFANKVGMGVSSLKIQAEQQQQPVEQYYEQPQQQEGDPQ